MKRERYAVEPATRGNVVLVDRWDGMVPARCVATFQEDVNRPGRALALATACCAALNEADTSWHPSRASDKPASAPKVERAAMGKTTPAAASVEPPAAKPRRFSSGRDLPPDWDEMDGFQKAAWMARRGEPKREQGELL